MADFAGEKINLFDVYDSKTAAQIIADSGAVSAIDPIRESFGPGWFLDVNGADKSTGKANCNG